LVERKRFSGRSKIAVLFLAVFVVLVVISRLNSGLFTAVSDIVLEPVGIIEEGIFGPVHFLHRFFRDMASFDELRSENRKLRIELAEMKRQLTLYREASLENARLKRLLKIKDTVQGKLVVSRVIGFDVTPWISIVLVDKGVNDGIWPDSVVLSGEGVAGRVLSSSPHFSKVMLVSDRNSRIPALVQRSRARGILEGLGHGMCSLSFVEKGADVAIDDLVVTSGTGGVFPKGLLLGRVIKVEKGNYYGDLFRQVEVKPAVDLWKLEELLIVKGKGPLLGE